MLMTYADASTITVSLSSLPPSCGSSRYTATISPSHGTIMMINKTFFTFTGLTSNTSYSINIHARSPIGNGRPAKMTVMTQVMQGTYTCTYYACVRRIDFNAVRIGVDLLTG